METKVVIWIGESRYGTPRAEARVEVTGSKSDGPKPARFAWATALRVAAGAVERGICVAPEIDPWHSPNSFNGTCGLSFEANDERDAQRSLDAIREAAMAMRIAVVGRGMAR